MVPYYWILLVFIREAIMSDYLNCFIRNAFILAISIYAFFKLLNKKITVNHTHLFLTFSVMFISILSSCFFIENQALNWIFILLSFILLMKFITKLSLSITYTTVLFSFSLSFISFCFSSLIVILFFSLFYYDKYQLPVLLMRIIIGIFHFILIYIGFHTPRLRKGMTFLYHIPSGNIGSTICVFLIAMIIMFCQARTAIESFTLKIIVGTFLFCFLLIYWWNYHLTQTYRKFLRRNEIDSLNLLLEERNQEILYLKSENDKLARIIHKDNKIIPALSMALIDSQENGTPLDLSALETDSSLLGKLKQLYEERVETLAGYQQEILRLPQTSFDSVNAVLSYMQTESLKQDIPFQVMLFDGLDSTIPAEIVENDFTHILSDLLANAVNACKDIPSASIQVYLGRMENIPSIKVLNTGNVFDADVLKDLGLARHTTHAGTGGSGIGLMDIWKIKEQYRATLMIDETANSPCPYTSVNILFNHKKHYIVQSDRHKELSARINRPDIMIISKE